MKKPALTLVELVVSLTIIVVIGTVVLVSFTILDRRRLETAARNLIADLSLTREMAIKRHQNYVVTFDQGNDTYTIHNDVTGEPLDPARPIYRLQPVDLTMSPPTLTFRYLNGSIDIPPGASGIIRLQLSGRNRQVRVFNETGYVRME